MKRCSGIKYRFILSEWVFLLKNKPLTFFGSGLEFPAAAKLKINWR
jgi:hypothetical protein